MRVSVNTTVCSAYGNCVFAAPDVFDLDSVTNLAVVKNVDLNTVDREALLEAAADCPVRAIELHED